MSAISFSRFKGELSPPVRVLIVDDSVVMRSVIERMFEERSEIEVASKVATATHAFDFLAAHEVDIILLDHEMPGENGLDVLPRMVEAGRGAHVVMLSSHCQNGSEIAVKALSLGASDAISKPLRPHSVPAFADMLIERFQRLAAGKRRGGKIREKYSHRPFPEGFRPACIGIGASTGGIQTLAVLLSGLREKPAAPILITQHLPEVFVPYYAQQVRRMTDLPVSVARSGMRIVSDHIYIAPGNHNLSCRREGGRVLVVLSNRPDPDTRTRPSVNQMFEGIADCYGAGALGIVLTGIGRDGTVGAGRIVEAGGVVIAQDERSSIVWGMPGSVTRAGLTSAIASPEHLAGYLLRQSGPPKC